MNGAPDWQDGECCFRCRTQFSLVARKHHCRNCGNIFCAKCSAQQIPIPRLNIDKSVRVCDGCYEKISSKSEDPLTLALNNEDKEQIKTNKAVSSSTKSTTSSSSTSSNRKPAANASAPSEQELKEEEELQLALALSLSETPTKVSFPDCRQFEESAATTMAPAPTSMATTIPVVTSATTVTNNIQQQPVATMEHSTTINNLTPEKSSTNQISQQQTIPVQQMQQPQQQQPPYEYNIQDRDREVFAFVAEIQSTLEIFNNRLNACKLRNRPIANDSAIQSIFLKLNSETQPKLSEFIKNYEDERAGYEQLQDKLSQISDARAALDALREEHQEKMRELAAEAEKQRQSQLASKLEAMRQKKSQMMQYQRDLALQRIREQEMMLQQQQQQQHQPQHNQPQPPPVTVSTIPHQQHLPPQQQYSQIYQQPQLANHQQASVELPMSHQQPLSYQEQPNHNAIQNHQLQLQQQQQQQPHQQQQSSIGLPPQQSQAQAFQSYVAPPQPPGPDYASLARFEQQYLPKPPKPDEDTPLISFDD